LTPLKPLRLFQPLLTIEFFSGLPTANLSKMALEKTARELAKK
jgi:hypothetical protein